MIKFKAGSDEDPIFGFGISEGNVKRLRKGQPIAINMDEMGANGTVYIFYGKTERDLVDMTANHIGPDTKLKIHNDE